MAEAPPLLDQTPRGWWQRNWKWFVPVATLAGLAAVVGAVVLFVGAIFGFLRSSDVCQAALARVRADSKVSRELGTPIAEGFFVTGNINVRGSAGDADLAIPIRGPKGGATIYAQATKAMGRWHFKHLVVEFDASRERIDLVEGGTGPGPPAEPAPSGAQPI